MSEELIPSVCLSDPPEIVQAIVRRIDALA